MKIAVSSWSLNKKFVDDGMTMADFVKFAKEEFGVDGIEAVNWMVYPLNDEQRGKLSRAFSLWSSGGAGASPEEFAEAGKGFGEVMREISAKRPDNLGEIKEALKSYGIKLCNMPIDVGNISQLDEAARKTDLEQIKFWIDIASELGSESARVNTGHQPEGQFDMTVTANSYRELAEYAKSKGVILVLENHGGMSADPENIIKLFKQVDNPNFRICPDFGNFEDEIRYDALDKIWQNPVLVHAKTYAFDEDGEHVGFDFRRCMEIAKAHNYNGYYSIEFEGPGEQVDGVKKTIALLKKYGK